MSAKTIISTVLGAILTISTVSGTVAFCTEDITDVTIFDTFTNEAKISDINGDGVTDISDAVAMKYYVFDNDYKSEQKPEDVEAYDVNGDGKVNAVDYVLLRQTIGKVKNQRMKDEAEYYGFDYEKDGRILVWHDEFDREDPFAESFTERIYNWGDRRYDNSENLIIDDGILHLICQENSDKSEGAPALMMCTNIHTQDRMVFKYGHAEMYASFSYKRGGWSAWWMFNDTPYGRTYCKYGDIGEVDIVEIFANPDCFASVLHKGSRAYESTKAFSYTFEDYSNLTNEFHLYALEWTPETISFLVDETLIGTYNITEKYDFGDVIIGMDMFHEYFYFIIDNEIYTSTGHEYVNSPGKNVEPEDLPVQLRIDWIRLYQNPETDGIHLEPEIKSEPDFNNFK